MSKYDHDIKLFIEEMVKHLREGKSLLVSLRLTYGCRDSISLEFRQIIRKMINDIESGALLQEAMNPEIYGNDRISATRVCEEGDQDYLKLFESFVQ